MAMPHLADIADQVSALDNGEFWIFTVIMMLLSVGGGILAVYMLTRSRLIEDTPTSKIRSAAQGYVELEGIARLLPGEPVLAPLSNQPCAWWKYSVEEKRTTYSNGRSHSSWTTIESATSDDLFQLVDDTGDCVVDPDGAQVIPNRSVRWYGSRRRPDRAPATSQMIGFGSFRYHEQTIQPGSPLYTLGWFRTEGGIAHSFSEKDEVRELLAEWKADQVSLLKEFDQNKDGQIDIDEWAAVRKKAIQQVRKAQLERAIDPDIHVLCRPPRRLRYILSTKPQDQLISHSRRYVVLGGSLFMLAGIVSVWLISVRGII